MIGRTATAHYWGKLADIYGRRVVLMTSLIGSGFACLWFGMTDSYGGWKGAVVARGVIGGWNSIVGVTKTLATEVAYFDVYSNDCRSTQIEQCNQTMCTTQHVRVRISDDDENHDEQRHDEQQKQESRIVGMVMSMRAWGFLIAPAIAGYLADPLMVREKGAASSNNLFTQMLQSYPYLLPNLLGALLCWITAVAVFWVIPETLEDCKSIRSAIHELLEQVQKVSSFTQQPSVCHNVNYGSFEENCELNSSTNCERHELDEASKTTIHSIWSRRKTRNHLMAYWLYSFVIICIDEAFPLYCISRNNGLGQLSESDIGTILSIAGLVFAVGQFPVYTWIVDRFGIHGSLSFGCLWGVLPISFIPFAALTARFNCRYFEFTEGFIALVLGLTKIFQSAFFSGITVATNRTVPKKMRSSMNGFGGMGAGGAKALGPLLAGYWMAMCLSWDSESNLYGSVIAFLGMGSLSLPLLLSLQLLEESDNAC